MKNDPRTLCDIFASAVRSLREEGVEVVLHEFAGGHRVDEKVLKELA